MTLEEIAKLNLQTKFIDNPCKGIILGKSPSGKGMQFSWIMERNENRQNLVYEKDDQGRVWTEVADPSKVKDPSLIMYTTMRSIHGFHIVSNGRQTDSVYERFSKGVPHPAAFEEVLQHHYCESDNFFTPRITGYNTQAGETVISVLQADPDQKNKWKELQQEAEKIKKEILKQDPAHTLHLQAAFDLTTYTVLEQALKKDTFPTKRSIYHLEPPPGFGYCVTTSSQSLESFETEPFLIPIKEGLIASMYPILYHLNKEWRVAFAAKEFDNGTIKVALHNQKTKI